jgi:hypothetical protein
LRERVPEGRVRGGDTLLLEMSIGERGRLAYKHGIATTNREALMAYVCDVILGGDHRR